MPDPTKIKNLKKHDDEYYNGEAKISDDEYDVLKEICKKEHPGHPYFSEVGSPIKIKNQKINLPYVLGSLNKIKIEK